MSRDRGTEGDLNPSKLLAAPGNEKQNLKHTLYVTFVGSQGPHGSRRASSGGRAGVDFNFSPTGGLTGPRTVRSPGSSPGEPASWQPWSPVWFSFYDWWGLPPAALFYFMIYATPV